LEGCQTRDCSKIEPYFVHLKGTHIQVEQPEKQLEEIKAVGVLRTTTNLQVPLDRFVI